MKSTAFILKKVMDLSALKHQVTRWRLQGKSIVFTNGVFDMLHTGHIASLTQAAHQADCLVVAVNSDLSVKQLKGNDRPLVSEENRALLLANLLITDAVIIFNEETPLELIKAILPDVLVKGGDYSVDQIAGAKEVLENGGRVVLADMVAGFSTTGIIEQIKQTGNQ